MATTASPEFEERPWGGFLTVYSDSETTVKILRLNPHAAISLQYHDQREEYWMVLDAPTGLLRFTINGQSLTPCPDVRYYVPRRVLHRITNDSAVGVTVLEVIKGKYDEADIVRIHDKYGR